MFSLLMIAALASANADAGSQAIDAQRKVVHKAASAPAQPADANYKAVMKYSYYGRNCPRRAQPHTMTDWEKPLQFILIPNGGRAQVLIVGGEFVAGDADRLRSFIKTAGPISEVQFDSGGGNAAEGPKVGRVIRAARLSTRVASGFACISSCSMAFLGGVVRQIDNDAIYGIHAFYDGKFLEELAANRNQDAMRNFLHDKEKGNAILAGQIQEYGQEMGISRQFFTEIMFAQRSEIFISDKKLGQLRVLLLKPMSIDQAIYITKDLISDGVLRYESDESKAEAKNFTEWMTLQHSREDVDRELASILPDDFRCLPTEQLSRYNIVNIVRH